MNYESLLKFHGEDFELYKKDNHYHISVEGYLGFDSLDDAIQLYETFLDKMLDYLNDNNYVELDYLDKNWKTIHQSRSIHVCYESNYYCIFLDRYNSTNIWECYYYLEDVISQLIDINFKLNDE